MSTNEAGRVKSLEKKLMAANKVYDKWSKDFDTEHLEEYYKGIQWRGESEEVAKKKYTINLTFASVEVNKPSMVFDRPQVRVQPRITRQEDNQSDGKVRACLIQDIIQTYIDDPRTEFDDEVALALHESHFRYGVIEVGYGTDWIDNPDAGKPIIRDDEELVDEDGKPVQQPPRIIAEGSEEVFVRRIPAHTFRVSISNKNKVSRNDFIGYYEWMRIEDIKANADYSNTSNLKSTGVLQKDLRADNESTDETERHHGMCKVWKIWEMRGYKHHVFAEGHKKFFKEDEDFTFLPFAVLRFHPILDSFYPIPPVSQWMSAQDEVNETRDAQRAHRRRFYRRYIMKRDALDQNELDKFETGGDGVVVQTDQELDSIAPIQDAPMSADSWRTLDEGKQDFMMVSSVGGEQRGVAESDTATQATIIDQRSRLRESAARTKVAKWLSRICRLIVLTTKENMVHGTFVKRFTDPTVPPNPMKEAAWQYIKAQDIGDIDFDIFIDLASMSPVTQEVERNSWNQVLVLISNPQVQFLFANSEVILRKTLYLYGIRSETEIQEIKGLCQNAVAAAQQATSMAALSGGKPGVGGPAGLPTPPNGADQGGRMMTPDKIAGMLGAASQANAPGAY